MWGIKCGEIYKYVHLDKNIYIYIDKYIDICTYRYIYKYKQLYTYIQIDIYICAYRDTDTYTYNIKNTN